MDPRRTLAVCGCLAAAVCSFLSFLTHGLPDWAIRLISSLTLHQFPQTYAQLANGFGYEVPNHASPTHAYLVCHFLLFVLSSIPIIAIVRAPPSRGDRHLLWLVLAFGAAFRLILIPSTPIHENDFYRYLWDGNSIRQNVNPYLFAPADVTAKADPLGTLFSSPLAPRHPPEDLTPQQSEALDSLVALRRIHPELHARIGHPDIPTIYPPAAQVSFWAAIRLTGGSPAGWKCFAVLFDLATCAVVVALLSTLGRPPSMVIVYAWCPLVLKEFANSGHHDSIPIFFSLLAVLFAVRHRNFASSFALAVATLGKFFPVAILPVFCPPSRKSSPWLSYLLFAALVTAAFIPFLLWQDAGFASVFSGLQLYTRDWQFFGGIFALIDRAVTSTFPSATLFPSKLITAILFAAIVARVTFSAPRPPSGLATVRKCFTVFAAFFLLNACAFPWYFAWVVPFLCFFPHPAWVALGGLLPLTYLSFQPASAAPLASAQWLGFPALSGIIWGGFLGILLISSLRRPTDSHPPSPPASP